MDFNKKWSKFSSRALLRILRKHTTFSTFLSKRAFAINFVMCFELLQQRLRSRQGHHPCQIIPCGAHSSFLRARTPKPSKTNGFLKKFSTAYQKITRISPQVLENNLHEFSKFAPARAVWILQNHWFFNIYDTRARASHFRTLFQRRRAPARGHNPLQIIPCGPHALAHPKFLSSSCSQ